MGNKRKATMRNEADTFMVITEFVSPLQQQLLDQKILLANTPADTAGQTSIDRETRKLRMLEALAEAEKARNPHYAVSRLLALDTIEAETGSSAARHG